jgi:hypothetical protein
MEPLSSCHLSDLINIKECIVIFCQTKASLLRPLSVSQIDGFSIIETCSESSSSWSLLKIRFLHNTKETDIRS